MATGTKFGSYEVVVRVGAGDMGEVYEGRDSEFGRDVTIKIPPEAFAYDGERLSRFQREAKMLAALNPLNIISSPDFERAGCTSNFCVAVCRFQGWPALPD